MTTHAQNNAKEDKHILRTLSRLGMSTVHETWVPSSVAARQLFILTQDGRLGYGLSSVYRRLQLGLAWLRLAHTPLLAASDARLRLAADVRHGCAG